MVPSLPDSHPLYEPLIRLVNFTSSGEVDVEQLCKSFDNFNRTFGANRVEWIDDLGHNVGHYMETLTFYILKQVLLLLDNDAEGDADFPDTLEEEKTSKRRPNFPKQTIESLEAWLLAHPDNPYPSSEEKRVMKTELGLSIKQINDWFINARRRKLSR